VAPLILHPESPYLPPDIRADDIVTLKGYQTPGTVLGPVTPDLQPHDPLFEVEFSFGNAQMAASQIHLVKRP
jgi:hypothetical protein